MCCEWCTKNIHLQCCELTRNSENNSKCLPMVNNSRGLRDLWVFRISKTCKIKRQEIFHSKLHGKGSSESIKYMRITPRNQYTRGTRSVDSPPSTCSPAVIIFKYLLIKQINLPCGTNVNHGLNKSVYLTCSLQIQFFPSI